MTGPTKGEPPGKDRTGPAGSGTGSGDQAASEIGSDHTGLIRLSVRIGAGTVSVRLGRSRVGLAPIACLQLAAELEAAAEAAERAAVTS